MTVRSSKSSMRKTLRRMPGSEYNNEISGNSSAMISLKEIKIFNSLSRKTFSIILALVFVCSM